MARRGRSAGLLDGYVVVDKGAGMTSHDVVGRLRRQLGERRIGHAGTLDPDATGVLVIAVGRSTRLMRFVTGADKSYVGELQLGSTTSTLDAAGEVTASFSMEHVTPEMVRAAAGKLTGTIEQVPPMVSAVRVEGRRLYELARAGEEIEREARSVVVERFAVEPTEDPLVYSFQVSCSSGTFVRTLAADLGELLGGGAHLRRLRRTRVGPYDLTQAIPTEEVSAESLLSPVGLLATLDQLVVDAQTKEDVLHGKVLDASSIGALGSGPWALLDENAALLAVYEPFGGSLVKPIVVHAVASEQASGDGRAEHG